MSQRICNSNSQPYWRAPDWHPVHMTWSWLASELRIYGSGSGLSRLPRAVKKIKDHLRKIAALSRQQNRQARRAGRGHR